MASDESYSRGYAFGAIERRGLVGGLRFGQVLLLGGACLSAVIEMRALSSGVALPAALFTIAIGALVALMPVRGRTAEQ